MSQIEALAAGMNEEIKRQNVVLNSCLKHIADLEAESNSLRNLLRDVYDVTFVGESISEGLMDRIRSQMARGR